MSLLDLDKFLGLIQDDNSATATSNLAESYDQNPKDHIERTRLQNQTGIPAVLMDDPIVKSDAKKQAYAKSLPKMKDFPATSSFAADPNNAPMIVDDVPALTSFEQRIKNIKSLWSDVLAPTPARAYSQFVKGVGGLDLWLGETLGIDWYLKQGKALQEESRITSEQIEKEHPTGDPSSWKGGLSSGLTSTYLQAPFMGAGFLAGSARAATGIVLSSMGATTYGQTYSERRSAGVGKASSSLSALWDGGIEVGTELLPTGTLLKMMKPVAKQALGKLLFNGSVYYGEEIVGESLATFFQDANAKIAGDPNMNTKQRVNALSDYLSSGEAYDNWMATLKATTTQFVIMGGAGIGINRLQNRTAVDRAKQQTAAIDELIKAADASNLKEGSPEAFIDFAQKAGDQHGTSAIYLQADRAIEEGLKQGVTEEQIPAWLGQYGVTPEDLTTAIHTGGHIQLDFGKWINGYTNDPALQALQKDFMISPEVLPENRVEEAAQIEQAHLERLTDLYNKDQENRINQDDVALWQEGVLSTPAGQKGLITSDSVALLAKRANLISQETGIPAIDILNRYLSPMNLRVEKYKDFQARQDGGEGMLNEDDSNAPVVNPPSNEVPSYFTEEFKTRIGNIDLYGGTIEQALNAIANRASLSEAGRRFGVEEKQSDGTVETVSKSFESTFPEYLSNKKETLNVIDKYLSGKKLTENQQRKLTYWLEGYAELDLKPEIESFKDDPRFKDIMSGKYKPGEATVGEDGMLRDENGNVLFQTAPPIDTPEFKNWFGDSKVVDESGKPLVVYHGGAKGINAFDPNKIGSETDDGVLGKGFYFDTDKAIADHYGKYGETYSVYLKLEKPFEVSARDSDYENNAGLWKTKRLLQTLKSVFPDGRLKSYSFDEALSYLGEETDSVTEEITDFLKLEGFDGVSFSYGSNPELVAFSPTQIKSVNNRGTFDPNNPNIYYQSEENPLENIAEEVSIDTSKLSKEALNRMNIYLKSKGYDVRGGQDIKELLDKRMLKDGVLWHPDWIAAYEKATKGVKSRKAKVEEKRKYTNINRKRLRELGYTYDLKEAGYITPQGKLIDLSGKREGGQRGERAYDHREAGGTIGMQEFMAEGNIRMDFNSGSLDIVSIPTARQLSVIQGIINAHNGEIVVDLWDGLGEQKGDYYNEPGRIFSKEYPEGTRAFKIINDIKTFYAGNTPIETLFQSAWHGSPHTFDKFSTSAIGTGEGAQAYGYGLYFAGNREVAEYYRQKLGKKTDVSLYIGGEQVVITDSGAEFGDYYLPNNSEEYHYVLLELGEGKDIADIIQRLEEKGRYKDALEFAKDIEKQGVEQKPGRLYKVELAPQEDEYLLWDKPLSEQSEKVKSKLEGIINLDLILNRNMPLKNFPMPLNLSKDEIFNKYTGRDFYEGMSRKIGIDLYNKSKGAIRNEPNDKKASELIHSLGIRGIKYLAGDSRSKGEGNYNYVIFSDDDVAIMEMYQKQNSDPLGVLAISNSQNMISLFEKADKSTFLHETAHIFLNDLKFVAETLGVQTAEWNKAKEWLGIGEDGVITVEAHEKFADHFEAYLKNGQAPTPELKSAFRTFKRWLTAIYEGVRSRRAGQLQITISPEISDLFDRLLATEQEIKAAREQAALIALMDDAMLKELSATPEQIDEYRRLGLQSEDSAREKRDTHKLNDREERLKEWKTQAESESLREPVYGFIYAMSKIGGIDRQSIVDQFGAENIPDLPQLWRKDGLDINVAIAENGKAFDYENAASFVENLKTMLPRKVWVAQRVAALEAVYDNSQDTQDAIRTSALRKMMEIESEWLAKKAVSQHASRAAMKVWAEGVINGKTMRQIKNVNPLLSQSRSHRQNAILAVREGRWEDALKYNEQARLTEELITASYRAAKAWTKKEAHWKRIAKWTNDNKSVKVGTRFRDQINRVLQQYGIARKEFDPAAPDIHSFVSSLSENELESASVALADWIGVQTGDYKALTWERLKDLDDALSYLYGHGRQEVEGLKTSKGIKVSEYAGQIIEEQAGLKAKPDLVRDDKKLWVIPTGKILKGVQKNYRKFFANTNILRFMAQRMDGYTNVGSKGKMGPAEQVVQDITSGMARSNDMWAAISAKIEPQIKVLTKDNGTKFDDLRLPGEMKRSGDAWNKSRVVAACLNMGTATNLQRLIDGYGFGEEDLHALAGKLTAEEWNSIQSIWDTISSLWPQIAGTHERLNFFKPKKVEAHRLKINTADGQVVHLEGGYYPIAYDKSKDQKVAEWMEKDDILASHEAILQRPTPKAGFTKGRVDRVFRPLNLSLSVLSTHFNDTIRYITLAEAVRDADRIFGNKDLSKQNIETFGREMQDMIRPALKNVLRPDIHDIGMFERGRIAMSIYYMGYNAWTAIQNTTGIFPAIRQAGASNYLNGIMHVISNPLAAYRAMIEASGYMRMRASNQERDMKTQLRNFKVDGIEINGKRYNYDDAKSLGFAGIRFIDAVVALPAWWGTYNGQMNEHGNIQKATEAADAVVNKALGSGLAIDSTGFGRHAFFRLLAPFMSFASTQQEVLATEREAWKQGELSTSEFLYGQMMTWVLPAMLSTFLQGALMYGIVGALGGGDNDKRKKTARDYATDIMAYRLMGIPFVRDVYNAIVQGIEDKAPVTSARMPVTEAYAMMQNAAYRVGNWDGSEKKTKALMWTAAELVSLSSGVPATRVYDRWMKGQKDIENGTGWWGNHFIPQEKKK